MTFERNEEIAYDILRRLTKEQTQKIIFLQRTIILIKVGNEEQAHI